MDEKTPHLQSEKRDLFNPKMILGYLQQIKIKCFSKCLGNDRTVFGRKKVTIRV